MRREIFAGVAALAILASGQAWAQTAVILAPEQRVKIKEYVVREKVRPVTVRERISVGATLPGDVAIVAVPSDWGPSVASYRYAYVGNQVVFVDPASRRIVEIID